MQCVVCFRQRKHIGDDTMSKAVALKNEPIKHDLSIIEQVVMQGDLSKLNPEQRVTYYHAVCESAGLNPMTRPFDYISLNGKLTLYAKKDATEQLRKLHGISIEELETKLVDDLYIVKATAKDKTGRKDEATGAVCIGHLKGDAKANAIMKAETKAKRRVTLSISGLGWCDETELETIPNATTIDIDISTGEIKSKEKTIQTIEYVQQATCAAIVQPEKKKREIKDKTPITEDQVRLINFFFDGYDSYKDTIMKALEKKYDIKSIETIPSEIFPELLKVVKDNHAKEEQKKFEQQSVNPVDF